MIDAIIVQTPRQSINKEEKTIVSENAMPADRKPAKRRQKDIDARWNKKHGKSYIGYKLSANADKRYTLIRRIKISTASEHDTAQRYRSRYNAKTATSSRMARQQASRS